MKEYIDIQTFEDISYLGQLTRSPRGRYLAFTKTNLSIQENRSGSHIHIIDLESKHSFQLTNGKSGEQSFQFLDEEHILFKADRDEHEKTNEFSERSLFYKIPLYGGEAQLELDLPYNVLDLKIVADDEYLFLAQYDPKLDALLDLSVEERQKKERLLKEEKDYEVLSEIPFWNDGGSFASGVRTRLYHYKKGDKKALPLTCDKTDAAALHLSPSREMAVFLTRTYEDKMPLISRVSLLDLKTMDVKDITAIESFSYEEIDFLEDGLVFVGNDRARYGLNQDSDIYFMNLDATDVRKIVPEDFDLSLWNTVGSDARQGGGRSYKVDQDYFYFITTEKTNSHLNRINKDGFHERLTVEQGSVDGFDVLNGDVYLQAFRADMCSEIYHLVDEEETLITNLNPQLEDYDLAAIESFQFTYANDQIDGFVMLPPDYDANLSYPAILMIHGGPKTVYGTIFFHEMQFLAAKGYILFFTNPRGSDGHGRDYADIRGRYGEVEYEQLMAFTDEVLDRYPAIDSERLGVSGGSYGGFMTNWIIGHTNRFSAAITQRSISNMVSMFAMSDIGYYFIDDQAAATPWTDADDLWRQSPLKYADRITTPTLVIHSDQDYRCPLAEGMQFFTALKVHGVQSRMVIFKGESHGLSRGGKPKHRVRRLEEIVNWFDTYLKVN